MNRLSVSNLVLPLSFAQFTAAVSAFKALVEKSFGCDCDVDIRAMSGLKWTSNFMHDEGTMNFMDEQNRKLTFRSTDSAAALGKGDFDKARYIEVIIRPRNESEGPKYAFAHLECKGSRKRQLTYYVQPDGADVMKALKKINRFKLVGDGYTHNTD